MLSEASQKTKARSQKSEFRSQTLAAVDIYLLLKITERTQGIGGERKWDVTEKTMVVLELQLEVQGARIAF
jgi:hypothetical protein